MRRYLADVDGALRLVVLDLYEGTHERDEFRVVGSDGRPVRTTAFPEAAGLPVEHEWGPTEGEYYVRMGAMRTRVRVHIEPTAIGPTERTPCRLAANPRNRKCAQCTELKGTTNG